MLLIQDFSNVFEQQTENIKMQFSEMLVTTLSHEVLTPLNAIINFSSMMMNYMKDRCQATQPTMVFEQSKTVVGLITHVTFQVSKDFDSHNRDTIDFRPLSAIWAAGK